MCSDTVQLCHWKILITSPLLIVGGSRYRPGGSDGGSGMGSRDIGGGADPLTGACMYMYIHVCVLALHAWSISVLQMYVWRKMRHVQYTMCFFVLPCDKGGRSYRPQEFSQTQVSVGLLKLIKAKNWLWAGPMLEIQILSFTTSSFCMKILQFIVLHVQCTYVYVWVSVTLKPSCLRLWYISLTASVFCEFHWTRNEDTKQQCLLSYGEYSSVDPLCSCILSCVYIDRVTTKSSIAQLTMGKRWWEKLESLMDLWNRYIHVPVYVAKYGTY